MIRLSILAAGLSIATAAATTAAAADDRPVLTVYTYDSFVSEWGPGPQVEAAFEAVCACDLNLVGAGDGAALLARVRLEGARSRADVVLGLDTNLTAAAAESGLFAPHGVEAAGFDLPVAWDEGSKLESIGCEPQVTGDHPITAELKPGFGAVSQIHPLRVKPDAHTGSGNSSRPKRPPRGISF